MSNLTEALSHITLLIKENKYEKDIEEPTPLEQKTKLVMEVKELFLADLSNCGISSITSNLAWDITEDVIGADEALNKGFLYSVLTYIGMFEDFYLNRREVDKNCAYWSEESNSTSPSINWKTPTGDNLSELF